MSAAIEFMGSFDILIINAGSLVRRSIGVDIDMDYWRKLIDINLTLMMLVTKGIIPHLNQTDGASIVNISSLSGRKRGHVGSLVYSM